MSEHGRFWIACGPAGELQITDIVRIRLVHNLQNTVYRHLTRSMHKIFVITKPSRVLHCLAFGTNEKRLTKL